MGVTTISKKGLTTVPREVREQLGLEEGDRLVWRVMEEKGVQMALVKPLPNPYKRLKGRRRNPDLTYEKVEEMADKLIFQEAGR